ncbi:hypothetical protein, partial [Pseudomonas aeruginosa]|uniref:hypothetical protein n=1 Tax=Pseudomonas aeruginosa TaxID=287 RepID=UPI001CA5F1D3
MCWGLCGNASRTRPQQSTHASAKSTRHDVGSGIHVGPCGIQPSNIPDLPSAASSSHASTTEPQSTASAESNRINCQGCRVPVSYTHL